ncbi:MAG TPA: DMT family transporter [Thermoleophilaceae bacterium]
MERRRELPAWQASLVLLSAIWGASFMFIKVGLRGLDPLEVAFSRCLLGAITLLVLLWATGDRLPRSRELWARLFLLAIFFNSVPFTLFSFGEQHVSSVVAGIWNATVPLFTAMFAIAWLPEERPTTARVIGLLVGFAGVLVVLGPWAGLGGSTLLGSLLCLGAPVCYGIAFIYTRRHIVGREESLVSISCTQVLLATLQLAVITPFFSSAPSHLSFDVIASMIGLGALGTGIAYVLNFDVIVRAGATTASLVTYLVPIFSTFFGVVVLSEGLSWNEPVGALVIIAGVAISQGRLRRATVPA